MGWRKSRRCSSNHGVKNPLEKPRPSWAGRADAHARARSGETSPAPRPSGRRGGRAGPVRAHGRCSIPRTVATARRWRLTQSFCFGTGARHLHGEAMRWVCRSETAFLPQSGRAQPPHTRDLHPRLHDQRAQTPPSSLTHGFFF